MKKITILLALLLFAAMQSAFAQRTITGKVISSEDGQSIPGVSVVVKGITIGMATDSEGNFTLNVTNDATIVVSFMGFKTVEIAVGNQNRFDIMLQPDARVLDGIVITEVRFIPPARAVIAAMDIVRDKKTLTTSIQSISGAELRRAGDSNFMNAIDGKVAGVNVNGSVMETIRGIKSFRGPQAPLFIIDGVPISDGSFNIGWAVDIGDSIAGINIEDIESITILKGANAAVLYGSAAANGVIVIITKKR